MKEVAEWGLYILGLWVGFHVLMFVVMLVGGVIAAVVEYFS